MLVSELLSLVASAVGYLIGTATLSAIGYYIYWRSDEKSYKFNAWTTGEQAINNIDLSGKTAIVTGCNTGIGKETARVLVKQNCNVIMACRSESKAKSARKYILNNLGLPDNHNKLSIMILDLSSLDSIKSFANKFNSKKIRIDYLINNAGVMAVPEYRTTIDGIEMQFGVNHLGHFYLTNLLMPSLLLKNDKSFKLTKPRVINVSSLGEGFGEYTYELLLNMFDTTMKEIKFYPKDYISKYDSVNAYSISKTCNVLFTRELINRFNNNIISISLHPGSIPSTELSRHINISLKNMIRVIKAINDGDSLIPHKFLKFIWTDSKNILQGSATTLRCVSLNENEINNGSFYHNCRDRDDILHGPAAFDKQGKLAEKLWEMSKILIESKGHSI